MEEAKCWIIYLVCSKEESLYFSSFFIFIFLFRELFEDIYRDAMRFEAFGSSETRFELCDIYYWYYSALKIIN